MKLRHRSIVPLAKQRVSPPPLAFANMRLRPGTASPFLRFLVQTVSRLHLKEIIDVERN